MHGGTSGAIPISQLLSRVEVDLGNSEQALREHRAQLEAASQTSKTLGSAASAMAGDITQANTSIKQITTDLENYRTKLQQLQQLQANLGPSGAAQLTGPIKEAQAEITKLEAQLQSMGGAAQAGNQKAAQSFLQTVSSVDALKSHLMELQAVQQRGAAQGFFTPGLQQEINRTEAALRSVSGAADDFGNSVQRTSGHLLEHAVAYAVVYAGIHEVTRAWQSGIDAAVGYQMALLKVDALTVSGAQDTRLYGQAIVQMSQHMPATAKELGDGLFYIESHGIKGAAALDLLKQSALGSEAGLGKTSDIARIAAGAVEAYGEKNLSAARAVDILTAGVKEGSLAPETLANSLGKVVGIASHMGITFEEVIANVATLTRQSVPAAQAVTDLSSVMTGLNNPSAQAKKQLAELQLTAGDLRKSIREDGLLATLAMLEERTGGNSETIQILLPNVRALRDMYGVTGAQAEAYAQTLQNVKESQGGTAAAADIMSHAVENQQKVLTNNWNALIIGLDILPKVSGAIVEITERIQRQTEAQEKAKESEIVADAIREQFASKTGETTDRILADAKLMNMSFEQLNRTLASVKINPEFIAQMDYLAGRAGSFPDPFGANYKPTLYGPSVSEQGSNAAPTVPSFDFEAVRRQSQQIAEMGAEARRLHTAAEKLQAAEFTPGLPDVGKIKQMKAALLTDAAEVKEGWRNVLSPEDFQKRAGEIDAIVNQLAQENNGATASQIAALDQLTARYGAQDAAVKKAAADDAAAKRDAAARAREAREAHEADPLAGIREGMAKDREDLIGIAGSVMSDLNNAIALKGQQGARAAGAAFAGEARRWGQEIEKAGVPGWEDAYNRLMSLAEVAVVTGSPDVVAAIHQLLVEEEQEIKNANIGKAMEEATAKSNLQMLEATSRNNDQLLRAEVAGADARAAALQSEVDREYDIWAGRQVDRLTKADQDARELLRIQEQWAREDTDRQEQQLRAQADRDTSAKRAAQDRARDAARTIADLQDSQSRATADQGRARQREEADALYEHNKRVKDIQTTGGPDVAKKVSDENASYNQQVADRTRKRQEDDAEATIKRSEQVADAQKRIAEQAADAQRRVGEQSSDLKTKQGEQDADLIKARARQLQSRVDQNSDAEWLKNQRLHHEQAFFTDAESLAQRKLQNDLARIDATYDHELAKAAATDELIAAKRSHDDEEAHIKTQERFHDITPEEATAQLGTLDAGYFDTQKDINDRLRGQDQGINERLRQQIADSLRFAPGFVPGGHPALANPSEVWKGTVSPFLSSQADSLQTFWKAITSPSMQPVQQPSDVQKGPISVVIENVDEVADAATDRPVQMSGEDVEDVQSKVRRNRNRPRAVG